MSLLCVLVKKARVVGNDENCNTYVVLKINNVKSTTSVVKGLNPSWEQEFYFDVNDTVFGLQVELWDRGKFRDKLLGLYYIKLNDIVTLDEHPNERWIVLDSEVLLAKNGQVTGTFNTTGHCLLLRLFLELPADLTEEESKDLHQKLEYLNDILDKEGRQLQDVTFEELNSLSSMHLDQNFVNQHGNHSHSHFSDDSDYTSDVSYPINQQANLNYPMPLIQTTTQPPTLMTPANELTQQRQSKLFPSISRNDTKPRAFVQPLMRDVPSSTPAQRRERFVNPAAKSLSLTTSNVQDPDQDQEPLCYVSQPPMKRKTTLTNYDQER